MLVLAVILLLVAGAGAYYKFVWTGSSRGTNGTDNPSSSALATPPAGTGTAPSGTATAAPRTAATPTTPSSSTPVGSAVVLPFSGLEHPTGVAVDSDGDIYVTDSGNNRVVKLPGGSQTQVVLPFTDLSSPYSVTSVVAGRDIGHRCHHQPGAVCTDPQRHPITALASHVDAPNG